MASKQEGRGKGLSGRCGYTGPVVQEYLRAIVHNVTWRAWWIRMRICTNSGAVYSRSSFDELILIFVSLMMAKQG